MQVQRENKSQGEIGIGPFCLLLKDHIDIAKVPFSDRGARLVITCEGGRLVIRMTERWYKLDQGVTSYRKRPPIIYDLVFTDSAGSPLEFTMVTYPHRIDFQTRLGVFSMAFADTETLFFSLPEEGCGVCFSAHVNLHQSDRRGGVLRVTGDIRRNIAYTTNRKVQTNTVEEVGPDNGPDYLRVCLTVEPGPMGGFLLNLTPRLGLNRYVPEVETVFNKAAREWEHWFASVPSVEGPFREMYYYAWWVMRSGLASTRYFTTREAMMPSKLHYVGVWQWDAYFHTLAYRHIDKYLARDQIRIFIDHQRADGLIPDAVHDEGTITHLTFPIEADVTKPPLLAWAVWKMYELDNDAEFLAEIYEPLVRYNYWWFSENDPNNDGLCEYLHPFSSGLDDSPLWDGGMPVTSPDLNTYLVLQMENLARIATVLGLQTEAAEWEARAQELVNRMIATLWDEETGLFWARRDGEIVKAKTPFSLFPLMTGRLPDEINRRLVAHLSDPQSFWTRFPVPTVAKDDPSYEPMVMWRGPTWINVNYLLVEGLKRIGQVDLAAELRQRTFDLVNGQQDIFEYYNPETGEPGLKAAPVFGWSAALIIDMAIAESRE